MKRRVLTIQESIDALPDGPIVKVKMPFADGLKIDFTKESLIQLLNLNQVELAGETALKNGYGLAFMSSDFKQWIFIQTDPENLKKVLNG